MLSEVLPEIGRSFPYPKSVSLISDLLRIGAPRRDDIVLDSFAGSGTTAQAVLSLNREDGGDRRFILVECEGYADTITAERVRRVIRVFQGHATPCCARGWAVHSATAHWVLKSSPPLNRQLNYRQPRAWAH